MADIGFRSMRRRSATRGMTVIEVLVALVVILFVLYIVYWVFLTGSRLSASTRVHLSSLKFAEMEMEEISDTPYDELPPETHKLAAAQAQDGSIACRVVLGHVPVRGSVRVQLVGGESDPFEDYEVDYSRGIVIFPAVWRGREAVISYGYEYPRRELAVIPKAPPFEVRLRSYPLGRVTRVVDSEAKPVPVSVDRENGVLLFKEGDRGKSITVEYRGRYDRGIVQGAYLSGDLASQSSTDSGIKLLKLTETWVDDGSKRRLELSCVRAR